MFPFPTFCPLVDSFDPPGSTPYTTAGAQSFVVPNYETSLTVTFWGGGASGAAYHTSAPTGFISGNSGTATTCASLGLTANGGSTATSATGGAAGTASGGDTNTTGQSGGNGSGATSGKGGDAPGGGVGGASVSSSGFGGTNGNSGSAPGAGGSGGSGNGNGAGGGGSGGRCIKTYYPGDLTPGSTINFTVGAGGALKDDSADGGAGATGEALFAWT